MAQVQGRLVLVAHRIGAMYISYGMAMALSVAVFLIVILLLEL